MNAIKTNNLSKKYDGFTLDNINLTLKKGSILGLVGANGAGKSTTINLILNAICATNGTVEVLSVDNRDKKFTNVKQDIGVVLDNAYYPEILNIKDINKIMKKTYKNWQEKMFFEFIKDFGLPLDKKFKDFSRGMKMQLSIAVALSHKAKLLILDEATGGLDPMVREKILDMFHRFVKGTDNAILMSSHIVSDLEKICDCIAFIHKGKLLFEENKKTLLSDYGVATLTKDEFLSVDKKLYLSYQINHEDKYELLVLKNKFVDMSYEMKSPTLEEIIILMSKEAL